MYILALWWVICWIVYISRSIKPNSIAEYNFQLDWIEVGDSGLAKIPGVFVYPFTGRKHLLYIGQ